MEYFNSAGARTAISEKAQYYSQTTMHDSISGTERMYFASGRLFVITPYANVAKRVQQGVVTCFYENGKIRSEVVFYAGERHGSYKVYYPNGKVEQQAQFVQGVWQSGNRFTRGGKALPFYDTQTSGEQAYTAVKPTTTAAYRVPTMQPPPQLVPLQSNTKLYPSRAAAAAERSTPAHKSG